MGKTKDQDLTSLGKDVAEKDIVSQLGSRFEQDEIYSRIGQTIIVAINPSRQLDICSDSNAKNIGNAVKDGKDRDAHVFELAANSYFDMVRDKEDQSLLFL